MSPSSRVGFSLCAALIRSLTLGLIVTVTALLPSTATYAAAIPSESFVQQNVDNGLAVLNDRGADTTGRPCYQCDTVSQSVDLDHAGLLRSRLNRRPAFRLRAREAQRRERSSRTRPDGHGRFRMGRSDPAVLLHVFVAALLRAVDVGDGRTETRFRAR